MYHKVVPNPVNITFLFSNEWVTIVKKDLPVQSGRTGTTQSGISYVQSVSGGPVRTNKQFFLLQYKF